jgi:hypothetical protein
VLIFKFISLLEFIIIKLIESMMIKSTITTAVIVIIITVVVVVAEVGNCWELIYGENFF